MNIIFVRLLHFCAAGYEVQGLERIPDSGPALIIYYHGAVPLDIYYLIAKIYLKKRRLIYPIGDRFLFYIPGRPIFFNREE